MGFYFFLDLEALDAVDSIPEELQHAIVSTTLHIAIHSPNHARSLWCLAELCFTLKSGAKFIPIFGHVDPSHLRWVEQGKGICHHAFAEHENKGIYTQEKLHVWKTVLCNSSFISGYTVNNNEVEGTHLKNIVICSLKIMKKVPLWVAEHPSGCDEIAQSFVPVSREEKVKLMEILGMGGFGKSTLAKELLNRNISYSKRCSHLQFNQLNALWPNKDKFGFHGMVIETTGELGVPKS